MEQAINLFTDGITSDMHPLNTSDKVLTSALNATTITFNGNEHILLNDMGNTLIQDTATGNVMGLSEGFVPLGMKEYGGILYIASYNPSTKEGELGTIPSPKLNYIFDSGSSKLFDPKVDLAREVQETDDTFNNAVNLSFIQINDGENSFAPWDLFIVVLNLKTLLEGQEVDITGTSEGNDDPRLYTLIESFESKPDVQITSRTGETISYADYKNIVYPTNFPIITTVERDIETSDGGDVESFKYTYGWYTIHLWAMSPGRAPIHLEGIEQKPLKYYLKGDDTAYTSKYWFIAEEDLLGKEIDVERCQAEMQRDVSSQIYRKYPNVPKGNLAITITVNLPQNLKMIRNNTTGLHTPFTYCDIK